MAWQVNLPPNNVSTFPPGSSGGIPSRNCYSVIISEANDHITKEAKAAGGTEATSVKIVATINEPGTPWHGKTQWLFMGLDMSKEGVIRQWNSLLKSLGVPEAKVKAGINGLQAATILNKPAFIFLDVPEPDGMGKIDVNAINRSFCTKEEFTEYRKVHGSPAQDGSKPAGATATGTQTPTGGGFNLNAGSAPAPTQAAPTQAAPTGTPGAASASDLF